MKKFRGTVILFVLACCVLCMTVYGKDSYGHVVELRNSLAWQQEQNEALIRKVKKLKSQVVGLQKDERTVEITARNELGVARPDELVVIFEKKDKDE